MFGRVKLLWKVWGAYSEVKDMGKMGLIKVLIAGAAAGIAAAAATFLETGDVNLAAIGAAALAAALAYLKKSPLDEPKDK